MKQSNFIDHLIQKACAQSWSIALPESQDPRIQMAERQLRETGACKEIWLWENTTSKNKSKFSALGQHWISPSMYEAAVYTALQQRLGQKYPETQLRIWARMPLYQAVWALAEGKVDSVLAGAVATTADVIRAGLHLLGVAPGIQTISGAFVLVRDSERYVFSDCGVVIDPTPQQLAEIGASAASLCEGILQDSPQVAFLSFSTYGSARHPLVEKVQQAVKLFRSQFPNILCDGELQGDAALDAEIRKKKAPQSPLAQNANVLIFPGLESGNISYKLMQRLGGFEAYGPILLGFPKPLSDLSRGASHQDIFVAACINILRR